MEPDKSSSDRLRRLCLSESALYVPTRCFKVVQQVSNGKILFCGIFTNNDHATKRDITEPELEKVLKYRLPIRLVKTR